MHDCLIRIIVACLLYSGLAPLDAIAGNRTFSGQRAIMDGDIGLWTSPKEIDQRLQRIKDAGFTVYMPAVWYGRGTTWPSRYAPWDFTLNTQSFVERDPLRYAIEKAHQLGLEVHPWFTLALRWNEGFMPEYALEGVTEGPHAAFDVHSSAFRRFMAHIVSEVVANYDVDGVNLDYGRAMGVCRSAGCQVEYRALYNRSLTADALLFRISPTKVPSLIEYQENAVTAMIRMISNSVRAIKSRVLISADGHPELARYEQGQNTIDWLNKGLIDVILRMDYHPHIDHVATETVRGKITNPDALTLLISNMAHGADLPTGELPYSRSGEWLSSTMATISNQWPNTGVAVYFYKYLSEEQIAALKRGASSRVKNGTAPAAPLLGIQ